MTCKKNTATTTTINAAQCDFYFGIFKHKNLLKFKEQSLSWHNLEQCLVVNHSLDTTINFKEQQRKRICTYDILVLKDYQNRSQLKLIS